MTSGKRPIRTCRHEAAHAIVAEVLGYTVLKVVIRGAQDGFNDIASRYKAVDPLRMGTVYAAGLAAEMRWHRASPRRISASDGQEIHKLGFRGRSKATVLAIARGLVEEHHGAIDCLAHILKVRDVKGREVSKVLRAWKEAAKCPEDY